MTAVSPTALRRPMPWYGATLLARRRETDSAVTLLFHVDGWPESVAGQRVDVRLTAEDGYSAQRTYSLSRVGEPDRVEITVQALADGEVSPFLVQDMEIGDQLEVRGPIGGWFVWRPAQAEPVYLVAGGSGIAPLMSMVRARRATGSRAPFRLLYSARSPAEEFYAAELRRPEPGLDVSVAYTRQAPDEASRPAGRVTVADVNTAGWPPEFEPTCYVCGPTGFVEVVANALVALGHRPERVRTERFGPSS